MTPQEIRANAHDGNQIGSSGLPGVHTDVLLGLPVPVIHVGHDQPSSVGALAQRESELPDVRFSFFPRESADDVTDRPVRCECEGAKQERTTRTRVVLLDRCATPDGRPTVREHEPVVGKKSREPCGIARASP
jgi:hypothetical protein